MMIQKEGKMEIPLREFKGGDYEYFRFRKPNSLGECPNCGKSEHILEDHWPPNYGGAAHCGNDKGGSRTITNGSQKFVCTNCKTFFVVAYRKVVESNPKEGSFEEEIEVENEEKVVDQKPLKWIEKPGSGEPYWATPNDDYKEKYYEKHGQYPMEAYA